MPPEQKPTPPVPPTPSSASVPVMRKPAIRTMRSDAEELFKTTKPSLLQMIGNQPRPTAVGDVALRKKSKLPMVIGVLTLVAVVGVTGYFLVGIVTSQKSTQTPATAIKRPAAPALFATESSRTITVKKQDRAEFLRLMRDTWQEVEREGTVKRVVVMLQDGPQEYPASLGDFFEMWRIDPPTQLAERLDQNLMVFMYAGKTGNRLGLAVRTREPERTFADMLSWEPAMLTGISQLFFDERAEGVVASFEDRTYRNIDWRYLKLSQEKDLGIGYAVFPVGNVFIMTIGKEPIETTINRLFDGR